MKILVSVLLLLLVSVSFAGERSEQLMFVVHDMQYHGGQQVFAVVPMRPAMLIVTQDSGPKTLGKSDILKCRPANRMTKITEGQVVEYTLECADGVVLTIKALVYP